MPDPMVDILWRWKEHIKEVLDPFLDAAFNDIKKRVDEANKTGDHSKVVEAILDVVNNARSTLHSPDFPGDPDSVKESTKRLVKAIYDNCPGAERAVKKDGSIDPDYLPD